VVNAMQRQRTWRGDAPDPALHQYIPPHLTARLLALQPLSHSSTCNLNVQVHQPRHH
jgi:hypothetical protein